MRTIASAASLAASIFFLNTNPLAACYGCQGGYYGGYYPVGAPAVQVAPPAPYAPPVVQPAPVYQAPVVQPPVVQNGPVVQTGPVIQTPPVVVEKGPTYIDPGPRYNGGYGRGYGRTVFYEQGPEIMVSYREYSPYGPGPAGYYDNGWNGGYDGGWYGGPVYGPAYYGPVYRPWVRPWRRPVVCSGGAFETGQLVC
jgi:hypothetical protein